MYLVLIDGLFKTNSGVLPSSSAAFTKVLSGGQCVEVFTEMEGLASAGSMSFEFFATTDASYVCATVGNLIWE